MAGDGEPTAAALAGPYRRPAGVDPAVVATLGEALSGARRTHGEAARTRRRLTGVAAVGYLVVALIASPGGEGRASGSRTVAWSCVAAGATYALILAGRAGARAHEIEAEIAGIERLAAAVARSPGAMP